MTKHSHVTLFDNRKLRIRHEEETISLVVSRYTNGRIALQLYYKFYDGGEWGWEPYATASVNLPNSPCEEFEVYIKDYSENEGIAEWLIQQHIIHSPVRGTAHSGFVSINRYLLQPWVVEIIEEKLA